MEYFEQASVLIASSIFQKRSTLRTMNLLEEAIRAKVKQFAYIHVLKGETMAHLQAIKAKQDFVEQLKQAASDHGMSEEIPPRGVNRASSLADFGCTVATKSSMILLVTAS